MADLVAHLAATRTHLELAKLCAQLARENAALKDRAFALEHELFWTKVALRDEEKKACTPSP